MVVLPGGAAGAERLKREPLLAELLRRTVEAKHYIAAICAAPTVLAAAGLLRERQVTSHPSVKDQLSGVQYREDPVVVDGSIVTSRAPGTALAFGFKLVELLQGSAAAVELRRSVLAG
jgi:4-methyl-5(b-hydroxyethyl)-thiazole monophosphate biosynthesis